MTNKRVMKRRIKAALIAELLDTYEPGQIEAGHYGQKEWVRNIMNAAFDYRFGGPTEAELRRFRHVLSELHREAFAQFYE